MHKNCTFFKKNPEKRAFFLFFGHFSVEGAVVQAVLTYGHHDGCAELRSAQIFTARYVPAC